MENTKTKIIDGTKYIIKSFFSDDSLSTTVDKIQRIIENKIISEIKTAPLKDTEINFQERSSKSSPNPSSIQT